MEKTEKREKQIEKILELEALKKELEARRLTKDLLAFNKEILQVEDGPGCVPLAPFHEELCSFITDPKTKKKLILVPRGHLKSTLVTVGYSLMRIAEDPSVRILIANATYDMAVTFLSQIKKHLRENDVFKEYYGELAGNPDKWSENMIAVGRKKVFGRKEATVTAYGIGGNLVSQHYDVVIMDDVVNRDYINTTEQIEKTILFYKDALDLLEPGGVMIVIGTRWHDADLYGWILDKSNPEQVYSNFKVMIRQAFTGNLETEENLQVLFPDKYNRDVLRTLKMEKGPYEFCSPAETPILMADWTEKPVSEIKVGDEVVGFYRGVPKSRGRLVPTTVEAISETEDYVYDLELESGRKVRCTKTHEWYTKRKDATHRMYKPARVG